MTIKNDDRPREDLLQRGDLLQKRIEDLLRVSSPAAHDHASKSARFRLMILVPLVLFLVWEVITRSLVAYLADVRPELAIRLRSTDAAALLNLAQDTLDRDKAAQKPVVTPRSDDASPTASEVESASNLELAGESATPSAQGPRSGEADSQALAQIRPEAELALLNDPLNARAFGILGRLADRGSHQEQTEKLMQAALRRSLHEAAAAYWMMQKSFQDQDYRAALHYADTLFRTTQGTPDGPEIMRAVMPMLGKLAETPSASGELKQLLAGNPPWRTDFFNDLPANISDARAPLELLLSLKNTATPPMAADLGAYLNLLIGHGYYDVAYYTWLQFLPAEQLSEVRHLFNGSFEVAPSGLPFDWVFTKGSGVTIKIAARPDQEAAHALFMEFGPGRVDFQDITQLIMLAPGSYQFQGKYQVDIDGERGLQWRITCANQSTTQLAESPVVKGSQSAWTDLAFAFTVPETDCPAQYVRLVSNARWESEQFISGSIWFDDLQIANDFAGNP